MAKSQAGPKTNNERLVDNQKATLARVQAYINEPEQVGISPAPILVDELLADPLQAQLDLQIRRDAALGVVTTVIKGAHDDGTQDLVRDARTQGETSKANKDIAARCSRSIDVLNTFRAAQKVLELNGIKGQEQALKTLVEARLKVLFDQGVAEQDNKEFNKDLVNALKNLGVKEAKHEIAVARNFASLDNPQFHVSTITEQQDVAGKPRAVVESNNMLLGLTDKQKEEYRVIAGTDETEKAKIDWYNQLSTFDKKLVRSYAAKIADGNTLIPTQLREYLPGLRNAYTKTTSVQEPSGKLNKVLETLQSGTVSFHGKGDKVAHTQGNLEQLDTFLPPGKTVNINPLNSPEILPGVPNLLNKIDRKAPGLIRDAQKQRGGGSISVTPFNIARSYTYNDNSGFDKALYEIGTKLEAQNNQDTRAIAYFLKDGQNEQTARAQLNALKASPENLDLAQALGHAMAAKRSIVHPHSRNDPQNSNLELATNMSIVSFQCTQGALLKAIPNLDVELILSHCASGKDRGGLLATKLTHDAVSDALGFDSTNQEHREIMEVNLGRQINAGHTQMLASINGGTPGCHGIKSDTKTACPEGSQYESLHEKTAESNKLEIPKTKWQEFKKFVGNLVKPLLRLAAVVVVAAVAIATFPITATYAAIVYRKNKYTPPPLFEKPKTIKEKSVATNKTKRKSTSKEQELDRDDVMFDTLGDKLRRNTTLYDDKSGEEFMDLSGNAHRKGSQTNQRPEAAVGKVIDTAQTEVRQGNTLSVSSTPAPKQRGKQGQKEAPPSRST